MSMIGLVYIAYSTELALFKRISKRPSINQISE